LFESSFMDWNWFKILKFDIDPPTQFHIHYLLGGGPNMLF
jgi:hypothetical protein